MSAGRPESQVDITTLRIKGGGRVVLGQNVSPDTEWDIQQTFHGEMIDFRFYDVTLSLEDMLGFSSCQEEALDVEPLYGFERNMSALELSGSTELINATLTQMCIRPTSHLTMFPEKLPFDGAFARCRSFLGYLSVPDNRQENDKVYDDFVRFNDQCTQGWAALYWLGIEGNVTAGTWRNMALDTPLGYGRWLDSWEYPTDDYPCATYGGVGIPAMWYNADCGTLTCALCNFTGPPIVRMRGHCKESKFDRTFTVYGYHNGRPAFQGHFFTQIIWDNDTWVLRSRREAGVEARMVEKRSKGYPLGLSAWDVHNDDCPVRRTEYLVTLCDREDFTCSDGSCVPLSKRCDQVANCPDNSDELNCQIIIIPRGYSSDLPPPSTGKNPLRFLFALVVTSVRVFDLVGFKMELDVSQSITWKDARLTFSNLREGDFTNQAKASAEIWQPLLTIHDGAQSPADISVKSKILRVNREAPPLQDDDSRTGEDKLYHGANHTMKMTQQYTVGLMCQFSLQMYPFDTQLCTLTFNVSNMEDRFEFIKGGVNFSAERRLLEYRMVKEKMFHPEGNLKAVQVTLKFKNQYGYYIGNAVVPSLFMVVICYLTLLFDMDDFMDRIMVSLTSLLVLASLFSQTSQSIPKTAYLKLIDVWYICVITVDFLIIVVLVFIENLRLRFGSPASSSSPGGFGNSKLFQVSPFLKGEAGEEGKKSFSGASRGKMDLPHHVVNRASLVIFPAGCVLFCVVFFMIGFITFALE
ncbi:uncharacterized protein LOC119587736 [Penaeus monodon]|uniref:uncharacterized protein LOC119587736 n=1 Tax=Penaeus monodon TaxID=6687 RepID=UPI0018A7E206|nr:uncharacterized protein LOC119587736 [Penaeus monodon]